jgi:hypothetical protein
VDAVLAGINTAKFQTCFLKAERISYKKMPLIISGTPYKNHRSPKWQILPKFLRSALLVDRHFAVLLPCMLKMCGKGTKTT